MTALVLFRQSSPDAYGDSILADDEVPNGLKRCAISSSVPGGVPLTDYVRGVRVRHQHRRSRRCRGLEENKCE